MSLWSWGESAVPSYTEGREGAWFVRWLSLFPDFCPCSIPTSYMLPRDSGWIPTQWQLRKRHTQLFKGRKCLSMRTVGILAIQGRWSSVCSLPFRVCHPMSANNIVSKFHLPSFVLQPLLTPLSQLHPYTNLIVTVTLHITVSFTLIFSNFHPHHSS